MGTGGSGVMDTRPAMVLYSNNKEEVYAVHGALLWVRGGLTKTSRPGWVL